MASAPAVRAALAAWARSARLVAVMGTVSLVMKASLELKTENEK